MDNRDQSQKLIGIWGDVVDLGSMVKASTLAIVLTMGLYFIAPTDNRPLQLAMGLGGSAIAFIINSKIIKPKRIVETEEHEDDD